MSLSIRLATEQDSEVIFTLIKELAEYERVPPESLGITLEKVKTHGFGNPAYFQVFLAEQDHQAVGYLLFSLKYSASAGAPVVYMEDLYVNPAFRRRGIAKLLFTELTHFANEKQCSRIDWQVFKWNESAVAFYKTLNSEIRDTTHYMRLIL